MRAFPLPHTTENPGTSPECETVRSQLQASLHHTSPRTQSVRRHGAQLEPSLHLRNTPGWPSLTEAFTYKTPQGRRGPGSVPPLMTAAFVRLRSGIPASRRQARRSWQPWRRLSPEARTEPALECRCVPHPPVYPVPNACPGKMNKQSEYLCKRDHLNTYLNDVLFSFIFLHM